MSLTTGEMSPADIAAVCGNRNDGGFGFGGDNAWWIIILLLFGWGRNGFTGGGGGAPCATQADVRAAVDQQTLISKIDQQTYGIADTFTALNNTLNNNFRGVDQGLNALSAQLAQCCCDTRAAIQDNTTQGVMNTNAIQRQISDCCCDLEKANMQNRFDAQTYNCNTLQAIDKLGDRIIDYMSNEKVQALRDENHALRMAASQAKQNQYLLDQIRPCPVPAYITCNPYAAVYGAGNACGYGNNF
jgi:hypothetical protein